MAALPLLLLLLTVCASFFSSSEAQDAYNRLTDDYKKGVDLALEKLHGHAGIHQHYLFFKSLLQSDIEPGFDVKFIFHHFYFKATKCSKGAADPTACQFRNDRPLIDCGICYKTYQGDIEREPKPYLHCVQRMTLTAEMKETRVQHCNRMSYSSGAPTLLTVVGEN